ncbi:ubiquitin-like protein [Heliocybe sulcata]|uniref:Ubiquitin-like protein n=1 Tax=Heliocybe sulcata TaxID=5364 RepID=A0A5C3N2T3_9AGAM|nr:ubiquitin-like protein [Heliocybe sulcata]
MQLFLQDISGTLHTIQVEATDKVDSIRIKASDFCPKHALRLKFAGRELNEDATFEEAGITSETTVTIGLSLRGGTPQAHRCPLPNKTDRDPSELKKGKEKVPVALSASEMRLYVKMHTEDQYTVVVERNQSIKKLKQVIEASSGVPVGEQRLLLRGLILNDSKKLTDYNIANDNVIQLWRKESAEEVHRPTQVSNRKEGRHVSDEEVQIFVRNLNGRTMAIMVALSDSVEHLQRKVEEKTQIPPQEQRLLYAGKQLEPGRALLDYGVQKESTLHLGGSLKHLAYSEEELMPCSRPRTTQDCVSVAGMGLCKFTTVLHDECLDSSTGPMYRYAGP